MNAVAGGELKMVKFLWNLVSEIDALIKQTPQTIIEKRAKEVDELLKKLKANPPKDGITPTTSQLIALITPLIPKAQKGDSGKTPTTEQLLALIEPLIPDPVPGEPGKPGKSVQGKPGRIPKHEWRGTFIRFELPNGEWGEWTNLQGTPAEGIEYAPGNAGGSMPYVTVVQGNTRFEGVTNIVIGENLTAVRTSNGVIISGESGGSGSGINFETPAGDINDTNLDFVVLNEPVYIVVNGAQYFAGEKYTYTSGIISLEFPVGEGGFIRSAYSS